jgi:LAS superfamily LD-carboxypeptidase LdcB
VVKQMQLFVSKADRADGNLSLASRSLAPPGYSFHGVGDFDVGIKGWGARNFTDDFATTDEFKKLLDLGYIDIRYPADNRLGVRFEPWHIKVS